MSKEFGLDWKRYNNKRMQTFIEIMNYETEKANNQIKKNGNKRS